MPDQASTSRTMIMLRRLPIVIVGLPVAAAPFAAFILIVVVYEGLLLPIALLGWRRHSGEESPVSEYKRNVKKTADMSLSGLKTIAIWGTARD